MATVPIDHGSSEIPPAGSISRSPNNSLSSASSPPPCEPAVAGNPSGAGGDDAAPATAGLDGTTRPSTSPPRTITTEDGSKLDLAIMGCSIGLVVPVAVNIMDLTNSWETPWKVLYGVLMIVSLASTVTGFLTAWYHPPAMSWGRRLSPTLARFGLVDAASLFVVFLACKLGRFGCAAGVASATLVVLVLAVVWTWSERRPAATTGG